MVKNIISIMNIDKSWQKVSIDENDYYLIAIKEQKKEKDDIDSSTVKRIRFEIAIDSGIKNQPLTIQYVNLDFSDITSGNNEINKITAFAKMVNQPKEFYIRPVSIMNDKLQEIRNGRVSISINVNSMDLGN